MKHKGCINRIIPFSSVDGPGNRTAIFLQGCNFNCLYCHNPETINMCNNCGVCVKACKYEALSLNNTKILWNKSKCKDCSLCLKACESHSSPKTLPMSTEELINVISKYRPFISGITVSGGECTLQSEFLLDLFVEVKKMGLTCFIDTNGSIPLYVPNLLVDVMDMAMIDLKSYDTEEHKMLTGMDNSVVIKNIEYLGKINKLHEVRTVIVPDLLNNLYNVDLTSKLLASLNSEIKYKLIKYRPLGVRTNFIGNVPTQNDMERLKAMAISNGCIDVTIV